MFANNPYAQGGWHNPQNSQSINHTPWPPHSSHPPTYGALPVPNDGPASTTEYRFTDLDPNILTCVLSTRDGRRLLNIRTFNGITVITNLTTGANFARIDWTTVPSMVEATGCITHQAIGDFLRPSYSEEGSFRSMTIDRRSYAWVPLAGANEIYLRVNATGGAPWVAKISPSGNGGIVLEIANNGGLFNHCVIAAVLLCSGWPLV
ncbi:hypothetical protein M413DRAFT_433484 [Hebeloma cylindrosporum]|uniref:Uncharacterized protein n=1 Tax=Hebeloma cylindrosporum TaxID=76867 RepID=A0A0C2Y2R2_HEBCY|nr:hypothetical protein M413DRAFT_433484 [Hebeloma cylindrosporum h7]